jgi:hypothetical protein
MYHTALRFGVLCLLLLTASGCRKLDRLTVFTMPYSTTVTIPATSAINLPFNILTPEITTNSQQTFESNNTRKDLVEEIFLRKLHLTITDPTNGNFNFLNSINIYISSPNVSETRIAWKDNIPENNANSLQLEATAADLQSYIAADKFTLRVNTVTDQLINTDYTVKLDADFEVNAKLIR